MVTMRLLPARYVLLAVMFQIVNTIRYFLTCHHVHSVKVHMVYDAHGVL